MQSINLNRRVTCVSCLQWHANLQLMKSMDINYEIIYLFSKRERERERERGGGGGGGGRAGGRERERENERGQKQILLRKKISRFI